MIAVNRRRYMGYSGSAPLPYDAEIMYLESTGTQYIDTGITPSNTLSFHCVYSNNSNNSPGFGNVFGARYSSQRSEYQISNYTNGTISVGTRNTGKLFYAQDINDVSFDGNNTVTINGITSTITTSAITDDPGTIVLFAIRNGGSVTQQQAGRIYSCSFGNVRNFIPVRKNGVGYMYDKVSGQLFENKGTGSFILGPDKPTSETMTRIEYLGNSDTQWFCISLVPDDTIGMRVIAESASTTDAYMAGLRESSGDTRWLVGHKNTQYYYGYGTTAASSSSMPDAVNLDLNYKGDGKFVVRGTSDESELYSTTLPTLDFTPKLLIWIIKARVYGSASGMIHWMGKLYSAQITRNNAIIMNLIPVRYGQVGYLYDTINDKFYCNAGTGDFILGQDIVPIEYLQNTGTEYIDTGFKPNQDTSLMIDFELSVVNANLLEARNTANAVSNSIGIINHSSGLQYRYPTNASPYGSALSNNTRYVITTDKNKLYVDGTLAIEKSTITLQVNYNWCLWALNNPNGISPYTTKYKLYACKVWDGTTLVRDYIPVRVGQVGYLYDKVSGQLYGNGGTGSFTLGPDKT